MGDRQCKDLQGDRSLGEYWERQFCVMAAQFGKSFTPMQIGRNGSAQAYIKPGRKWNLYTLPDVTIWTSPGEHHEIKHKSPTRFGSFSLEQYRLEALLWFANETKQTVLYTIHNHELCGGRDATKNDIDHWFTVDVTDLVDRWERRCMVTSYVNGIPRKVQGYYWQAELWKSLASWWVQERQLELV